MKEIELSDLSKSRTKSRVKEVHTRKGKIPLEEAIAPKKRKKVAMSDSSAPKKKKVVVSDSSAPKKKKVTDSVSTVKKKKTKRSKKGLNNLDSGQLIEAGEAQVERLQDKSFDNTREQVDQYVLMFKKLCRIARIAEKKYFKHKESKDIYALMKVYDQLREVIADMRALQDISEYVDSLDFEVMQPYVQQTAQSLLDLIRTVSQFADSRLDADDAAAIKTYLKSKGKAVGVNLNDAYRNALDNTRSILAG